MKIDNKQREAIARRMGYTGPMSKFAEYLLSSPAPVKMAEGGLVSGYAYGGAVPGQPGKDYTEDAPKDNKPPVDPNAIPKAEVPKTEVTPLTPGKGTTIPKGSGQVTTPITPVSAATATTTTATAPTTVVAPTVDAVLTQPGVQELVDSFDPAAQGTVTEESTVQGQLANLMQDFEGGKTPVWAAGAMTGATAGMNARGLGASSMAGDAITSAAMQAALPIAAQDAGVYERMNMQNLANEQAQVVAKNLVRTQAFFTDAATINATNQFNATNQIQVDTFNSNLMAQVEQFNVAQTNATSQFNAGERNAMSQFNATVAENRAQFNASNRLIVDQANAVWRQQVATINNANINEANRQDAQNLFDVNLSEMNNLFQERRDTINYAFNSAQNDASRGLSLLLATMSAEEAEKGRDQDSKDGMWAMAGQLFAEFSDGIDWGEMF